MLLGCVGPPSGTADGGKAIDGHGCLVQETSQLSELQAEGEPKEAKVVRGDEAEGQ